MALPASGIYSFQDINVELGLPAGNLISLNDTAVRNLFGQPTGPVDMNTGHGKASLWLLDFGANNYSDLNLRTVANAWGFNGTQKKVKIRFAGIITASSTAVPAIEIGSWPADVQLEVEFYGGQVQGRGGAGGAGGVAGGVLNGNTAGSPGAAAGPALKASSAVAGGLTVWLNGGSLAAGGGGGGGGGGAGEYPESVWQGYAGGAGGTGWNVGNAATGGVAGTGFGVSGYKSGAGGAGGFSGQAGAAGQDSTGGYIRAGGAGGAGGAAFVGSGFATKINFVALTNYFGALA